MTTTKPTDDMARLLESTSPRMALAVARALASMMPAADDDDDDDDDGEPEALSR